MCNNCHNCAISCSCEVAVEQTVHIVTLGHQSHSGRVMQSRQFYLCMRGVVNSKKSSYTLIFFRKNSKKFHKIQKIPKNPKKSQKIQKNPKISVSSINKMIKNRFFSLSILIPLTVLIIPLGLLSVSWSVCCQCHARNF